MSRMKTLFAELTDVWAIIPERLLALQRLTDEAIAEQAFAGKAPRVSGSIAIIPVYGFIQQRGSMLMDLFGGTSTDQVGAVFTAAMRNDQIKGVVLDVDSPGGTVPGVEELSRKIFEARGQKPIVAVANSLAASAAYWIASAADKLYVAPGGEVGSIGVFNWHEDWSAHDEAAGVKTTLISAGKYKVEGHPFGPLDDEARQNMQARVDEIYGEFVAAVARNRGVSTTKVRGGFGEGRTVRAKASVAEGMADRVASLERVLGEMGGSRTVSTATRAIDDGLTEELTALWGAGEPVAEVVETMVDEVIELSDVPTIKLPNGSITWVKVDHAAENHGDPEVLRKLLDLKEKSGH